MSKLRIRIPRKKRAKKKLEPICSMKLPGWLTRCKTMEYEFWSEKPECVPESEGGGFKHLIGWTEVSKAGSFYIRPAAFKIPESSPLYLHYGKMCRVWLTVNI